MKYRITEEDERIVHEFVERNYRNHYNKNRTIEELKSNIRQGKLGEIAYKIYAGDSINEIDWSEFVQMDGLDFTSSDGKGIQVKTIGPNVQWVTFYNWKWDRIAVLRIFNDTITLIGEWDKEDIKRISRKSKRSGWYFNPDSL